MEYHLIKDFTDPIFKNAFIEYFNELGIQVKDFDGLFDLMNNEGGNQAFIVTQADECIAFLQFRNDELNHWFFKEEVCFIREFWVKLDFRKRHIGVELMNQIEAYARNMNIYKLILTTHTAEAFYLKNGFVVDKSYIANNGQSVMIKSINNKVET